LNKKEYSTILLYNFPLNYLLLISRTILCSFTIKSCSKCVW